MNDTSISHSQKKTKTKKTKKQKTKKQKTKKTKSQLLLQTFSLLVCDT
jgi:hypothetical protein